METHNNVRGGKVDKSPRPPKRWETWVITNIWRVIVIKTGERKRELERAREHLVHKPDWAVKTPPPLLGRNESHGELADTRLWPLPHSESLHRGWNQDWWLQWLTVKEKRDKSGVSWVVRRRCFRPTRRLLKPQSAVRQKAASSVCGCVWDR